MSNIALLSRNGSRPKRQEYLQQSVASFFGELSWDGVQAQPPTPPSVISPDSLEQLAPLTSGLESVGTFFERFPWEGQPAIGAPVSNPGISLDAAVSRAGDDSDGDDMTLDAFSELF